MIQIHEVTRKYGPKTAVARLTLEIPPGEVFAFLGPNGAGKTTTIKMLVGLLRPTEGNVAVCGCNVVANPREASSLLGYVPDQAFLYDKLSGREFLEFVGQMYGLKPDVMRSRGRDLVDRLEMGEFLDQLTEGYSHGMKQRTVLAASLLHDPKVLVIDEPMVGLDPRTVRTVKDLMREMTRRQAAVFMSTHKLEVAEAVADRIWIIHHGRLVAVGTLEQLQVQATRSASLEDIFLSLTADEGDASAETIPH